MDLYVCIQWACTCCQAIRSQLRLLIGCCVRRDWIMTWSTTRSLLGRCLMPATSSPLYRLSSVQWLKLLSDAFFQHRDGRWNQSWYFVTYQLDWYCDICLTSGNLLYDLSIQVWVRILAWWCPSATIKARSLDYNSDCALQIFQLIGETLWACVCACVRKPGWSGFE